MSKIKLEVGKKYVTRDPNYCDYVEVISGPHSGSTLYVVEVFYGEKPNNGSVGTRNSDGTSTYSRNQDLVAEYKEEGVGQPVHVEVNTTLPPTPNTISYSVWYDKANGVTITDSIAKINCTCDIHLLMRDGCKCGAIQRKDLV